MSTNQLDAQKQAHRLFSVPEFSQVLGVTKACIRRWILERRISVVKLGRLVRIPESEATRLIEQGFRPAKEVNR